MIFTSLVLKLATKTPLHAVHILFINIDLCLLTLRGSLLQPVVLQHLLPYPFALFSGVGLLAGFVPVRNRILVPIIILRISLGRQQSLYLIPVLLAHVHVGVRSEHRISLGQAEVDVEHISILLGLGELLLVYRVRL